MTGASPTNDTFDEAVVERVAKAIRKLPTNPGSEVLLEDSLEGSTGHVIHRLDDLFNRIARAALQQVQTVDGLERVRERCARVGYITCAETRHVSLGRKVEEAILQLDVRPETEG